MFARAEREGRDIHHLMDPTPGGRVAFDQMGDLQQGHEEVGGRTRLEAQMA
jgi:hypothetical protein